MTNKTFGQQRCKCEHTLDEHDYKVKEGTILYGECKKCKCVCFKKSEEDI